VESQPKKSQQEYQTTFRTELFSSNESTNRPKQPEIDIVEFKAADNKAELTRQQRIERQISETRIDNQAPRVCTRCQECNDVFITQQAEPRDQRH
jgi:CRISPR/Cas system CSM-associated protein Csm5 (group 7 of RAMP superfamily)